MSLQNFLTLIFIIFSAPFVIATALFVFWGTIALWLIATTPEPPPPDSTIDKARKRLIERHERHEL